MAQARIAVRLRPRGHADEVLGLEEGVLQAKVAAPPVDGKANRSLCRLVARQAGVPPSRVTVLRGEKSRDKLLLVEGIDEPTLMERLGA